METFDYEFDSKSFEIFPRKIWEHADVVFHGTSAFYSEDIEKKGFIRSFIPFRLEDAKELVYTLKLPAIKEFDIFNSDVTVSSTLNNYIEDLKYFRLSFAYLSSSCIPFSIGRKKGGQILGKIRCAKDIISKAISYHPEIKDKISPNIKNLFNLEQNVANANGVVYAVKLSDYKEISDEYEIIYSGRNIPPTSIIGKVILPNNFNYFGCDATAIKKKNKEKILKGIGRKLDSLQYEE